MLAFRTTGYNGYGVQYSPYFDSKLAVATAANYGLVGNGKLFILRIDANGQIHADAAWETQDGLFDVAWSEVHENQAAVVSGDGLVKLFDTTVPQFPVMSWKEHTREVFSVNWNNIDKHNFVTLSWDGQIKVWTPARPQSTLTLSPEVDFTTSAANVSATARPPAPPVVHGQKQRVNTTLCVYNAVFSPHLPSLVLSCAGLLRVQVWDTRAAHALQVEFVAHGGLEALSCDWNKYRPTIFALAGTDKTVRVWDLRMIRGVDHPTPHLPMPLSHIRGPSPLNELVGHEFAVRKVLWSPHSQQELLSASYDMTARVWTDHADDRARFLTVRGNGCRGAMRQHKEFVIGCDYSLWGEPGWAATTGWDEMVYVWDTKRVLG